MSSASTLDVASMYRRFAGMVLRRARRFYGPAEAEEVVHEVFLKVLEAPEMFRGASSPSTWLYRVTTNHCLNRLRNEARRRSLLVEHAESVPGVSSGGHGQEATVFVDEVWRALDAEHAAIGLYYFVDGMTHDQIAEVVGCSPRTVGNRIDRIDALLREAARS
ncbi:MAG: RNA polymerase sigma factor [Myxococcota bacterium]